MDEHFQNDPDRTQEADQANMTSVNGSPDCLQQVNTLYDAAAPSKQSHPSLLLSKSRVDELQEDSDQTQGVEQVNKPSIEVLPDAVEQANTPGNVAQSQDTSPTRQSRPFPLPPELRTPHSADEVNIAPVKVSPDNFEQANTLGDVAQSQTAVSIQQSHPYALLSEICEDELEDDSGHPQNVDSVNIASTKVKPEVVEQANISPSTASPKKQSNQFSEQCSPRTPKDNEHFRFSAMRSQTLSPRDFASPAATQPKGTPIMSQRAQDSPKLPCTPTPDPLARSRRIKGGTGEVRFPVNMTPSRPTCSPSTSELQSSPSRVLPIGELVTSSGRRTYTVWAHKQPKPDCISTQIVITNVNSSTGFKSYSGVSRRSPVEVLEDFTGLLRAQGIELMGLNVVKERFVAVVDTEKGWKKLRDGVLSSDTVISSPNSKDMSSNELLQNAARHSIIEITSHKKPNTALAAESFPNITSRRLQDQTQKVRIENFLGYAQVPLGVAGPLTIHGDNQNDKVFAPLATTEPTLVASCSRGCKALEAGGGAHAIALSEGMSRAPVFRFSSPADAVSFYRLLPELEAQLKTWAESTSRFAKLKSVTPHLFGKDVHVRFLYSCGDASGQNMSTIATHKACQNLLQTRGVELKIVDFQLEGQMASDKKLAYIHLQEPRGVQVFAWGVLSNETCKNVLGSSAARIHEAAMTCQRGAIRAGMIGSNGNVANILAAMFIACGQDAASVLESGWAQVNTEYDAEKEELTASLFIPCVTIGTVGGGTMYATQREALEMLKCNGQGRKWALAETIAAFALALELSTISAMADDTFAKSHERLARSSRL
ncbi:hydroxymethylglutaryl-CoA reductase, partial [Aureobasidium melanogenum]